MTGEIFFVRGFEIQVMMLEANLDLAFTYLKDESHWMLVDDRNKVRDLLSVLRSFDGRSVELTETPDSVAAAMREAVDKFRSGEGRLAS